MEIEFRGAPVRIATGGRSHDSDPESPGIVLLHGSGQDRTMWQMQTRWLAHHGFRVAAVDLPGHGLSGGQPLESIEAMGEWTAALVHEIGFAPAHLVGFSSGSFASLEAASQDPTCAASLILIGTAQSMPVHPALLESSGEDVPRASRLMTSWGLGSRAHRGGHPQPGTWLVGASTALVDASPTGALKADMEASNAYSGAIEAASVIAVPVTFVLGREDKMTPSRNAAELIEATADSTVVTLDGTGHMMPIEDPIRVREAIASAAGWSGGR